MSSRQQPHEIEAMCLAERRALYWSDRKHAWCHCAVLDLRDDDDRQSTTACCPRQTIPDSCSCMKGCNCSCADCDCGAVCEACGAEWGYDCDCGQDAWEDV